MNEADTPNNGDLNKPLDSANVPKVQQASCPFDFILPHETKAIPQLPLLAPAENKKPRKDASYHESVAKPKHEVEKVEIISNQASDFANVIEEFGLETSPLCLPESKSVSSEDNPPDTLRCDRILELNQWQIEELEPKQDWVAEPDREKQALINSEFQQLLTLNQELRSANSDLYEQVEELKAALAESQGALQLQIKRSTVAETMLKQQAQELVATQEQINSLFQQLETALSTVQNQQTFIDNCKAQLEISQQRLAQLERECALIQTRYNDQSHQLLQSENTCRELRTRLMRQQRQTLQFKAALEKCLETPVPSYDFLEDTEDKNYTGTKRVINSRQTSSLFSNQKPIRPWSAELEPIVDNTDNLWQESRPSSLNQHEHIIPPPTQSSFADTLANQSPPPAEQPDVESKVDDSTQPTVSPSDSSNLEEQFDSVFQTFFVSQPVSAFPQPELEQDVTEDVEDGDGDDALGWQTITIPLDNNEELLTANSSNSQTNSEDNEDNSAQGEQVSEPQLLEDASPQKPSTDNSPNSNSPSPLLYPQRPPKGRKSLASVELPKFRPNIQ